MFKYKANTWDEYEGRITTEIGLVSANTYGEACEKVIKCLGRDNVVDITLESWENLVTLEEIIEGLK